MRLAAVFSVLMIRVAAAQPAPDPAPAPAPAPEVVPAPVVPVVPVVPVIDLRDDAAWRLYHQVFDAVARGERARARGLVLLLVRDHPGHRATALVERAELGLVPVAVEGHVELTEKPNRSARAELAAFQTLHGMALGIELCIAAKCDSGSGALGLTLLGGLAGVVVSLNAVDELTSGQRALLNSGTAWGAVNATLGLIATQPGGDAPTYAVGLMLGQGAGLAAGAFLFREHPTAGQVGLANSGGEWVGVLTGLTMAAIGGNHDDKQVATILLVAVDVGIAGGAYLATQKPEISRAQTLVIDAAGIAGAVGGGSLGVVISNNVSDHTTPALAAVGAAVGLGTAAFLTRHWSDRGGGGTTLQTFVLPVEHGRGGTAGIGFSW